MADPISRKQFFRQAFFQTAQFSADLIEAFHPHTTQQQSPDNHAFAADFPPEILTEEAQRLGINPDDRAAVLAAIAEKLKGPMD